VTDLHHHTLLFSVEMRSYKLFYWLAWNMFLWISDSCVDCNDRHMAPYLAIDWDGI
jgi:hypothetical protein